MTRTVGLLLAVSLTLATLTLAQKSSVGSLKKTLSKVQQKKSSARTQLKETRKKVKAVKGDIVEIDGRLQSLEGALEHTTERLTSTISTQQRTAAELQAATKKLESTRIQVAKRLRWMYVHGDASLIDAIVGSESIGQLASRSFLLQRIANADRELFDRFKTEQREVSIKKAHIDRLVVEIAGLKRDQEIQHSSLKEVKGEKASLLSHLKERQEDLEKLVRQLDAEEASIEARIRAYQTSRRGPKALPPFTGRLGRPVNAGITSGFGVRFHPILKRQRMHTGVDFGASGGAPIYAAADGIVITATYLNGYGNTVMIDHGGNLSTLYGHCSRLMVGSGQAVKKGQVIAAVGSTGLSTGPHLHFEVRISGRPVNPLSRI